MNSELRVFNKKIVMSSELKLLFENSAMKSADYEF